MRFLLLLVAACGSSSAPDPAQEPPKTNPPVDVPEVKEAGTPIAFAPRGMTVIATRNAVVIDGQSIATITNGAFDAAELEGGALGLKLARLTNFTQAWFAESTTQGRPADEAGLLLERTLTYRVLIQLMYSIKVAGVRRFVIAAQSNGELISLPIVLPDKKPVPSISRQPGRDLAAQIDALKNQEPKVGVPGKARIAIKARSVTPARSLAVRRRDRGEDPGRLPARPRALCEGEEARDRDARLHDHRTRPRDDAEGFGHVTERDRLHGRVDLRLALPESEDRGR